MAEAPEMLTVQISRDELKTLVALGLALAQIIQMIEGPDAKTESRRMLITLIDVCERAQKHG